MTTDPFSRLAADLEARSGVVCGGCGLPHGSDGEPYGGPDTCSCCPACRQRWVQSFVTNFPHIVGSATQITEAMILAANREMEAAIAELEAEEAEWERRQGKRP